MADTGWTDAAWASVKRGQRVADFLRGIVLVFAALVALGFVAVLVAAVGAEESEDGITLAPAAGGGGFFWSMTLGALYALATLLEVQSSALAQTLAGADTSSSA